MLLYVFILWTEEYQITQEVTCSKTREHVNDHSMLPLQHFHIPVTHAKGLENPTDERATNLSLYEESTSIALF